MDANDVLNVEDREDHSEHKEAEQWLREYLADGPVGAREAIRAANDVVSRGPHSGARLAPLPW